jgi:hypothetical protein|tara:strand:- start:282 stop:434 length:153 start_codon:yes stop_codon:yes gene_type:complete
MVVDALLVAVAAVALEEHTVHGEMVALAEEVLEMGLVAHLNKLVMVRLVL